MLQTVNIKGHILLRKDILEKLEANNNIYKLPETGATVTIYKYNKKLINVTGLKNLKKLRKLKIELSKLFPSLEIPRSFFKIDTIMLSYKGSGKRDRINLAQLYHVLVKNFPKLSNIIFEPELFSSLSFRCPPGGVFCQIFHTGSCQSLGLRKLSDIEKINTLFGHILKTYQLSQSAGKISYLLLDANRLGM